MAGVGSNDKLMAEINVTPFVDVMLVLLIIFMVTAPMMMQGMDVNLPATTSEPLEAKEEALVVSINKDGQVFISEAAVDIAILGEKLLKILENKQDKAVYLKADRDVAYGTVIRVMSEVKAAGIEKIGMMTEPVSKDETGKAAKAAP